MCGTLLAAPRPYTLKLEFSVVSGFLYDCYLFLCCFSYRYFGWVLVGLLFFFASEDEEEEGEGATSLVTFSVFAPFSSSSSRPIETLTFVFSIENV